MSRAKEPKFRFDCSATLSAIFFISLTISALCSTYCDGEYPFEEPGVGSPVPGGLSCHELAQALHQLRDDPALLAMEIVEYNPHHDRNLLTAQAAGALFRAVLQA